MLRKDKIPEFLVKPQVFSFEVTKSLLEFARAL
jgi:hypothetical protein